MLHVKVEVFKPYQALLDCHTLGKEMCDRKTIKELADFMDKQVGSALPKYLNRHPSAEEIRWEFIELGQGHYITLS